MVGAGVAPELLITMAPRQVAGAGTLLRAVTALWFPAIDVDGNYWLHLTPAILLLALGFGFLAVLASVAAAVTGSSLHTNSTVDEALLAGYGTAVLVATGLLLGLRRSPTWHLRPLPRSQRTPTRRASRA